ncbi:MAG: GNAT family N-acetyltransferase [Gemmatimonadota bacterium]
MRAYAPTDRAACLAIFDSNVPRYFTPEERAQFAAWLDAPPGPYFVLADAAEGVVGCGGYALGRAPGRADLCWGMVRADRQGEGLGLRLTRERLRRAVADPAVDALALTTSQHTRGFYERLGFRVTRVVPDGFGAGLDQCDMVMAASGGSAR